jgi:transcriptional regulator with XRE-family HTH domain
MPFGTLLRRWRTARGLSQLALATDAGISTRHLSFLETGRARPSREMVQLLASMLDVPAADRNALFVCAGYAPIINEAPVEPTQLESVRPALDFILHQQEPYPALVLDGQSNILMTNRGAREIFCMFYELPADGKPINASRTVFDPNGLRRYIANWDQCARGVLHSLQREVASTGSTSLLELHDELLEYPGVPIRWRRLDSAPPDPPLGRMDLRKDGLSLKFFSTLTTLVAPGNATPHLRIKSFFAADAATEQFGRRLATPQRVA